MASGTRQQSKVNLAAINQAKQVGSKGPFGPDRTMSPPGAKGAKASPLDQGITSGRAMRVRKETEEAFGMKRGGK